MKIVSTTIIVISLFASCASMKNAPKYQLSNGGYKFRQEGSFRKVQVYIKEDSLMVFENDDVTKSIIPDFNKDQIYLKRTFDIDVMTIGVKYRPATLNLPRQLTTDFTGNLYVGYRFDRFQMRVKNTPAGLIKSNYHRALTLGGFAGLGSTQITPWTTNNKVSDEYNSLILSRGFAAMIGINNLTVGLGLGWDYVTDRDQDVWIYQNKPWFGLAIGLNIN
jgi:hypothetical protein